MFVIEVQGQMYASNVKHTYVMHTHGRSSSSVEYDISNLIGTNTLIYFLSSLRWRVCAMVTAHTRNTS